LIWNTVTQRVESGDKTDHINKTVSNLAAGSSASVYTFNVNGIGAYEIKVLTANGCAAASYNKFVAVGGNSNNHWVLNFIGGMSGNGIPTATNVDNNTVKTTNPSGGCSDGSHGEALDYTLFVDPGTGELTITNNGNIERSYKIIIEKVFD